MKKVNPENTSQNMNEILNFIENKAHFHFVFANDTIQLTQTEDQKKIDIVNEQVEKVLTRQDLDGSQFLQVNFISGHKILITQSLIGFKPYEMVGFDSARIPKVVTTVDLISVSKAIEELFDSDETPNSKAEIEVLKKVYQSIMIGAENIGFKMSTEKRWFSSVMHNPVAFIA